MKKQDAAIKTRSGRKISKREIEWLGYIIEGLPAREAGRRIGLSARAAKRTDLWVRVHREQSRKPYLWDIWRETLDRNLRILDAKSENIIRELCLVAFSSIDRFVELPSREKSLEFLQACERDNVPKEKRINPFETIRVKFIEDIPKDLIPTIASIKETKDGIEVKLHSKMDALDKLARITKLFNQEPQDDVPFNGEINIHVNGSKSPLLLKLNPEL